MNFFKNKNVVTIVAAIICILIISIAYKYRVDKKIDAITVPVASEDIPARTEITKKQISSMKVASSSLSPNVITAEANIIGKFVNYNTFIPKDSFFYESAVVEWKEMPDSAWNDIGDGQTVFSLPVSSATTYGNSIYPGDKIDLYYQTQDDSEGKLVIGKLIAGIKVIAVKDSAGNHIMKKSSEQKDAAALIFAVTEEQHLLLRKAFLGPGTIFPVPRNTEYSGEETQTVISSEYLRGLIESRCNNIEPDNVSSSTVADVTVIE